MVCIPNGPHRSCQMISIQIFALLMQDKLLQIETKRPDSYLGLKESYESSKISHQRLVIKKVAELSESNLSRSSEKTTCPLPKPLLG